jgi:hypothetical protein
LLLGLLAIAGLLFIANRSQWDRFLRSEFYLCGWLAMGIGIEGLTAHPTFRQYFVLTVPFLAILAAAGLYAIGSRVYDPDLPRWPVLALGLLMVLPFAKTLYEDRDAFSWQLMQRVAAKVDQVTPGSAQLMADESIYFLTHRPPPPGMEFWYSHRLDLPEAQAALLHILPNSQLKRMVAAGVFDTVETCDDAAAIEPFYAQKAPVDDCVVFWNKRLGPRINTDERK